MTDRRSPNRHFFASATCGVACLAAFSLAQEPATQPAPASPQALVSEVRQLDKQLNALFPKPSDLANPEKRAASGAEGAAILNKIVSNLNALVIAQPASKPRVADAMASYEALLLALDDAPTRAAVEQQAQSTDAAKALRAKRVILQGQWYAIGDDAAKQTAVVEQLESLGKANPSDVPLTTMIARLTRAAATKDIGTRLEEIILKTMKNPVADQLKAQIEAEAKMKALEGKPLTLAGKTPEGGEFSTSGWTGKVILVDFWATWCGPCKAELPRVKKAYADYHAQGLEVLGVSNDYTAVALTDYIAKESMPWPELFDADAAADHAWNPITLGFGINGIPRMFLIDKKGICRSVSAREDFEQMIPKLLAE